MDDSLIAAFDEIVARFVATLKADGIELPTFMDTLLIAETERLRIRRFYKTDLALIWAIMKKPEVMPKRKYEYTIKIHTRVYCCSEIRSYFSILLCGFTNCNFIVTFVAL